METARNSRALKVVDMKTITTPHRELFFFLQPNTIGLVAVLSAIVPCCYTSGGLFSHEHKELWRQACTDLAIPWQ